VQGVHDGKSAPSQRTYKDWIPKVDAAEVHQVRLQRQDGLADVPQLSPIEPSAFKSRGVLVHRAVPRYHRGVPIALLLRSSRCDDMNFTPLRNHLRCQIARVLVHTGRGREQYVDDAHGGIDGVEPTG
jgi:hypothetical protein